MTVETPLLGRCKECDFALFATREQVQVANEPREVKLAGIPYRLNNGFVARCPNRHRLFVMRAIKGTYSKDHKCDSRCLNAKGHSCTCSCGGMNHGRGYAVEVIDSAAPQIVQANSDEITDKQANLIRRLLDERELPWYRSDFHRSEDISPEQRRENALAKLDAKQFTKKQASKTIEWLLTLPRKENNDVA